LQDLRAENDRTRLLAHEHFVAADVGLAFGAVEYQRVDAAFAGFPHLDAGREHGAAQAHDAGVGNGSAQRGGVGPPPVFDGAQRGPLVEAVRPDHDAAALHARRMADQVPDNGADGAGGRCVYGCVFASVAGVRAVGRAAS
jgi:hypothetical protein